MTSQHSHPPEFRRCAHATIAQDDIGLRTIVDVILSYRRNH